MKTPNFNGWEKLICPYFTLTCRRVLDQYLKGNGFTESSLDEIGGVMFSRFGLFLEVSYELELVPQALTVVLGVGDTKFDAGGHPRCVPFWYLFPRDGSKKMPADTRFNNEAELEKLLLQIKEVFLEHYAKPLWLNPGLLDKAIENFRAEFGC